MSAPKKAQSNQGLERSVTCPNCRQMFLTFVNFELKDGRLDFQMEVFEVNDVESALVSQSFTYKQQDDVKQKSTVECPYCPKTFELIIHLTKTIKESQLNLELSITTCAVCVPGEKKEKEETPRGQKGPSEKTGLGSPVPHRVKVFYMCSGETFRGDDQVKEQLMMDKRRTLHVQETNLKDSDIVIVFCPITSRVGSDVESSMRDKTVSSLNKPIILVLMHHTRDLEYSTAGTIWSEVYPNVVLDVHVLFHETKPGLLKCRHIGARVANTSNSLVQSLF
ncbi:uncharacterized protein LOC114147522 isoform X2 [Xiphophorus couchianus]|uniref:uncharacterized protein LOC114147522 isoform X2 n=1 Tax=Xiphophorus couchianus TaxID=32473 RepID=UPI0010165316|nr:uncharacterized protein LOC114147522 isoform X2 [Xiphophorus couchianus]